MANLVEKFFGTICLPGRLRFLISELPQATVEGRGFQRVLQLWPYGWIWGFDGIQRLLMIALWFFSGTQKVPPPTTTKTGNSGRKEKKKVYVKPPQTNFLKHSQKEMILVFISPFSQHHQISDLKKKTSHTHLPLRIPFRPPPPKPKKKTSPPRSGSVTSKASFASSCSSASNSPGAIDPHVFSIRIKPRPNSPPVKGNCSANANSKPFNASPMTKAKCRNYWGRIHWTK